MKTYRVAILGCRGRGRAAATSYHYHPRAELVGLCDLLPERYDELGEMFGVDARYDDAERMIRETAPDIVAIPTGTESHHGLAMLVLEHGVHIDIEKPLCVDLEEADEVLEKAREKGCRVAVHHQGRTGVVMHTIRKALEEGRIGELQHIHGYGKGYYGGLDLMNIGTHMINTYLGIGGNCRSVSATAVTNGHPASPEDVVTAPVGMGTIMGERLTSVLQLENGVSATLLNHRYPELVNPMIELCGSEGRLMIEQLVYHLHGQPCAMYLPARYYETAGPEWVELDPILPHDVDPELCNADDYLFADEFVRALDEGRDHECSGEVGRHVVEIMMGIFESAAYSRVVELPLQDRRHPLRRWRRENGLGDPPPVPRDRPEWLVEEDRRLGRLVA